MKNNLYFSKIFKAVKTANILSINSLTPGLSQVLMTKQLIKNRFNGFWNYSYYHSNMNHENKIRNKLDKEISIMPMD